MCTRRTSRGAQLLCAASEPADHISASSDPPSRPTRWGKHYPPALLHRSLSLFCDPLALDSATTFINQCQDSEQGFSVMAAAGSGLEAH